MAVWIMPGQTQLTRSPCVAWSRAMLRVSETTPAFEAQSGTEALVTRLQDADFTLPVRVAPHARCRQVLSDSTDNGAPLHHEIHVRQRGDIGERVSLDRD